MNEKEIVLLLKDILLLIFSFGALLFSIIQHKRNRNDKWAEIFRIEIAKLLALAISNTNTLSNFKNEMNNSIILVKLNLSSKDNDHIKLEGLLNKYVEWLYSYNNMYNNINDNFFIEETFRLHEEVVELSKKIIENKLKLII